MLCLFFSDPVPLPVPIWDARDIQVTDFGKIIKNMKKLPSYDNDMPEGSCAVVGFTINYRKPLQGIKKKDRDDDMPEELASISYNLRWAILLALPSDKPT